MNFQIHILFLTSNEAREAYKCLAWKAFLRAEECLTKCPLFMFLLSRSGGGGHWHGGSIDMGGGGDFVVVHT